MKKQLVGVFVLAAVAVASGEVVTYEMFGAVGDGKTDDQKAFVAAHAAANTKGLPVRAADGKTYYIGGGDIIAEIRTDVDFGTAKFIIDDTAVKNRNRPVFRVGTTTKSFSVQGVKTLAREQKKLDVTLPTDCLVVAYNDKVRQYIRYGANQNNGSSQREVFLVDKSGNVDPRTPIMWDFPEVTGIYAYPLDAKTLTLKGGHFTTRANQEESKYHYYARGFVVERSNVRIEGLHHDVTGELDHGAPYGGFISISHSAHVMVSNCVFTAHRMYHTIGSAGTRVGMGSYDLCANTAVHVSYVNCRQTTDILDGRYWGLFGSNYCKDLVYDGCEFSRFDAHMGVANATIRNSRLGHMGINAIGFGTFLVENSTVYGHSFFNLRSDYGSTWEGTFVVKNCTFVPSCGRVAEGILVNGGNSGKHDFGYPCHMPRRIVFDGLKIDDSHHPEKYNGPWIFGLFNKANTSADYQEDFPYHVTEEVVLRNVTTASGKPVNLSPNPYMFRNVKVARD